MRRFTMLTICLLALASLMGTTAWAQSPSFHYANASASGLDLVVTFKETGLGTSASTVGMEVDANATATYQCFNGGGNHPKAGNKTTVNGPVIGAGNFSVRHGNTTGSITVSLPGPGNFSCPSGQTLVLESGIFSNITITDNTTHDGPFSATPDSISVP